MKIEELKQLLTLSWEKQTCSLGLQSEWKEENPSLGQCAITTLIINDFLGGKIMRCMASSGSHYYNLINSEIVDLTVEQFLGEIPDYDNGEERTRKYLLSNEDTKKRYKKLLQNIKNNFIKYGTHYYKLIDANNKEYLSKIPGTYGGYKKQKIYGKMDCPSALKWIKKGYYVKERAFFIDEEMAIEAGYRPCAVCMPEEYKKWKEQELVRKLKK